MLFNRLILAILASHGVPMDVISWIACSNFSRKTSAPPWEFASSLWLLMIAIAVVAIVSSDPWPSNQAVRSAQDFAPSPVVSLVLTLEIEVLLAKEKVSADCRNLLSFLNLVASSSPSGFLFVFTRR